MGIRSMAIHINTQPVCIIYIIHMYLIPLFFMFQHHRGRATRQEKWVFGLVDTSVQPALGIMMLVGSRDTATLLPLIQQHVRPGTTVWSDEWRAYRRVQSLPAVDQPFVVSLERPGCTDRSAGLLTSGWARYIVSLVPSRIHSACVWSACARGLLYMIPAVSRTAALMNIKVVLQVAYTMSAFGPSVCLNGSFTRVFRYTHTHGTDHSTPAQARVIRVM